MWVDNKTSMGQTRMNTLVENLMLRRTKTQTSNVTGKCIVELPDKRVVNHTVKLADEEQKIYDHVFSFSQRAMIEYMKVLTSHTPTLISSYFVQKQFGSCFAETRRRVRRAS